MEAFQVSEAAVQWVSTAYLLALAVAIPVVGWAEERFGGRRCWITGLVIFLIGSFLCAVSPGLPALVVCRVLQGFGAGGGMPCAAGLWSGRAYNAAYFAAGGDCPQQGDHGGGRHYVHSHASSFAGTDPWTCSGRYRAVCSQLALAVSDQYSGGDSCNPVLCALARRGRGWSTHGEKTPL